MVLRFWILVDVNLSSIPWSFREEYLSPAGVEAPPLGLDEGGPAPVPVFPHFQ